jgi:hypothetical protein
MHRSPEEPWGSGKIDCEWLASMALLERVNGETGVLDDQLEKLAGVRLWSNRPWLDGLEETPDIAGWERIKDTACVR